MKSLEIDVEQVDGKDIVRLNGPIYEGSNKALEELNETVGKDVVFNFRNVTTTNTCGIAEWMEFLQDFREGRNVSFVECPPVIVMLINMIPYFRCDSDIDSVYRSYFCRSCNKEHWDFLVKGQNMPKKEEISEKLDEETECLCRECGKPVAPEVSADEFYTFLETED